MDSGLWARGTSLDETDSELKCTFHTDICCKMETQGFAVLSVSFKPCVSVKQCAVLDATSQMPTSNWELTNQNLVEW